MLGELLGTRYDGCMPAKSKRKGDDNLWQNSTTLRWHWEIKATRKDGSTYRKAGSSKDKAKAKAGRDEALAAFERYEGRAGSWTVESWFEYVRDNLWPHEVVDTTMEHYKGNMKNHVLPKIGGVRLDALTVPFLQEWANKLAASAGVTTTKRALYALSSVLTRAVGAGLIPSNPARNVKLREKPRVIQQDEEDGGEEGKMILTPDEQRAMLAAAKDTTLEWAVFFGLKFGLRRGETLGLMWSHVDLEEKVVRIRQQAQSVTGKGTLIVPPKSKAGRRDLPIPDALLPVLAEGKRKAKSMFVCCNQEGGPLYTRSSRCFPNIVKRAGFKREEDGGRGLPTTHDLRSTFASYMANEANGGLGLKPHTLMYLMGHSDISVTMKHYVRSSPEDLRKAMECIA